VKATRVVEDDPQTAGGRLISVAEADAERMVAQLINAGVNAVAIGELVEKQKPLITVLP
jgi:selenophosphate synthase